MQSLSAPFYGRLPLECGDSSPLSLGWRGNASRRGSKAAMNRRTPKSPPDAPHRQTARLRSARLTLSGMLLLVAFSLAVRPVRADEPAPKSQAKTPPANTAASEKREPNKQASKSPDGKKTSPRSGLDVLGFSVAPNEGGKARTSLFGVVGEGYKFVYVFDRSGSMGGDGRNALRAVKAELAESLKHLGSVHQFQIIFYNEKPAVFNPSGTPGRLAFATDENKQRATRFVQSISAQGGTDHEQALRLAIGMRPDVIFFLTDADDPKLTAAQLEKIRNAAAGIVLNTIEFGPGPKPAEQSFLETLARQNAGGYAYIDISKYAAEKKQAAPAHK
jgi:hypothetical protein